LHAFPRTKEWFDKSKIKCYKLVKWEHIRFIELCWVIYLHE
jgi:hypothetical protein